ncbi:phosphoglycerate mutase family protein, partial [Cooperia oncophora]
LVPTDLNIPNNPASKSFLETGVYNENPPITAFGKQIQPSSLTARALSNRGVRSKRLICSPALRSIQTAEALAKFLKAKIAVSHTGGVILTRIMTPFRLQIEPGLMEPLAWYRATNKKMPEFHLGELVKSYPIDTSYSPIYTMETLSKNYDKEAERDGLARTDFVLRTLGQEKRDDSLIFVAHAVTLAVAASIATSIPLVDKGEGETIDQVSLGLRFPPGAVVAVQVNSDGQSATYELCPGVVPPLSYGELYTNRPVFEAAV